MRSALAEPSTPLMDLNTTPLIDIMLVLLVMFIITIPIQTHAIKLDLPAACPACPKVDDKVNTITISAADQISWNDERVSAEQLRFLLRQSSQVQPSPELHVRPDERARYGTVDEVLAMIKRAQIRRFGFVGNEAYAAL